MAVYDDFTGSNGDPISSYYWTAVGDATTNIQSNKAQVTLGAGEDKYIQLQSTALLDGDFDIQVDITESANVATADRMACGLYVVSELGYASGVIGLRQHNYNGNRQLVADKDAIFGTVVGFAYNSSCPAKFKIVRTGDTFYYKYWTGSAWANFQSTSYAALSGERVRIWLYAWKTAAYPATNITFDNVTINSGTLVYPYPETEHLEITGYAPTTFPVTPTTESLVITGYAPQVSPSAPITEHLELTGYAPTAYIGIQSFPTTGRAYIRGYAPTVTTGVFGDLVLSLPALEVLLNAAGPRANIVVDLPTLAPLFTSGGGLNVDLTALTADFTGLTGRVGALVLDLPALSMTAQTGGALAAALPVLAPLFTGVVGATGNLAVSLPPFAALFEGKTGTLGQLVVSLPGMLAAFEGRRETQGELIAAFPALEVLFTGHAGPVATLAVELPALEALFTAYEALTGEMIVTLPALKALFEGRVPGRFDGVILQYTRPS